MYCGHGAVQQENRHIVDWSILTGHCQLRCSDRAYADTGDRFATGTLRLSFRPIRTSDMIKCFALIVAAGSGTRLGGEVPKQYLPLAGRAVLRYSAETFVRHPAIAGVRVVISAEHRKLYDDAIAGLPVLSPVTGGATRQESVRKGLESLA